MIDEQRIQEVSGVISVNPNPKTVTVVERTDGLLSLWIDSTGATLTPDAAKRLASRLHRIARRASDRKPA